MTTSNAAEISVIAAPDVEQTLLGCALEYPASAAAVLAGLEPDDFHEPRLRAIAAVVVQMSRAGVEPTPALVLTRMHTEGSVRWAAGTSAATTLHDCVRRACTPAGAGHYRQALIRVRWRRQADGFGRRLQQIADFGSDDVLRGVLDQAMTDLGRSMARLAEQVRP